MTPAELLERLVLTVPPPRAHTLLYHGQRREARLRRGPTRTFGKDGWACPHCVCRMRLAAVVIGPPATEKVLHALDATGPPQA